MAGTLYQDEVALFQEQDLQYTTPLTSPVHCLDHYGTVEGDPNDLSNPGNHPSQVHRSPTPYYGSFGVSEVNTGTKRKRSLVPIAPNPNTRRSTNHTNPSAISSTKLTEVESLLIRYKDEENLPWKDIALKFQVEAGRTFQVPALQMRYKRLREKLRVWSDADIEALRKARQYWQQNMWEIISTIMHTKFGAAEKLPAKSCSRKWAELHPLPDAPKEHGTISTSEFREREKTSWGHDEDSHESANLSGPDP